MATASLNKFTVPLATNQSASTQGLLMPKMKYRFRAIFENFGVSTDVVELTKQVSTISRPNLNFNPFVIDVYNSKVNLVGKPVWEPVNVTLRDDAGGNGSHEPTVLETWELYGAFITTVNYGEMSYAESTPAEIALSITYDNAVQTPTATGVGTDVGRSLGTLITG